MLFRGAHGCVETTKINQKNDCHKIQSSGCKVTGSALCLNVLKSIINILSFFKLCILLYILLYVLFIDTS